MKNERQEKILAIIAASAIETQEQLIDSLRKEGDRKSTRLNSSH